MSSSALPSPASMRSRSLGAKFFIVVLLALGMSLSGLFVETLTMERADRYGVLAASAEIPSVQPKTVLGIRLADSYRSMHRSLHYITLFLGLVFLTYFLFEVLTCKHVHPAQYALVGIAQTIFYLLLLSLAEHMSFDLSFLVAGTCTVALFATNAKWIFGSSKLARRSLAAFSSVYAFIYVLLRMEAYALLLGALVSFAAIAVAMYMTRDIDWYGDGTRPVGLANNLSSTPAPTRESWLK